MDEKIYEIEQLAQSEEYTDEVLNKALELALALIPEIPEMTDFQKERLQVAVLSLASGEPDSAELQ